jgi:hypothetical protein
LEHRELPLLRVSRRLIVLVTAATLIAAYAAAGFWLVPRILRSQAENFASETYGRRIQIGEIRFNPFTFELEVDRFSFPDADGERLASFEHLLVNLELSSLWRVGASFKEISIEKPYLRPVIREGGEFNFADLVKPFPESAGDSEESAKPPRLFVDLFRLTEGQVDFVDRTLATPYSTSFKPLGFELRDFSTTERTDNAYDLHAQGAHGASFDWGGNFTLAPLASKGRFRFAGFVLGGHWDYVRDTVGFDVTSGTLGLDGEYDFSAGKAGVAFTASVRELGIDELGIRRIGEETDTARFTKLTVSDASLDLAANKVDIRKVLVAGGSVQAWRDAEGNINLAQFTEPAPGAANAAGAPASADAPSPTAPEPVAAPAETGGGFVISAPDIELQQLVVQFEDREIEPTIRLMLDPFNLRISGFSTAPGTTIGIAADTRIDKTARLETDLKYALDDGRLEGKVGLASFDLTRIQPYLDRYTRMDLLEGSLTAELSLTLLADGGVVADGMLQVDRLRTVDKAQQEDFIKWDRLRAEGIRYNGRSAELGIKTLRLKAPYARVIIARDETVNVAEIMTPARPAPEYHATLEYAAAEGPSLAETQLRIDTVAIEEGSLNFADFWIQPNYAVSIQQLNGSVTGLSSEPASRARLDLEGKVDRHAPATIAGEVNLLSASLFTDVRMQFAGVDMTSVTPYSGRFAGYEIEKGKISIDVSYHVENRALDAKQRFVIDQLELGDKVESPDAVSLPLKLAVALLKDRNGVIDIDLPMTGSLDEPKFRLGPLIWKAFVGLLTKIATAPFALIGSLFGGGPEVNFVEFDPGATVLDPAGLEKMAAVQKALIERPALQLDVPMAYSAELDGDLIGHQALEADLVKLGGSQKGLLGGRPDAEEVASRLADPEARFELLAGLYRAEAGAEAPLPGEAAAFEVLKKKERTTEGLAIANRAIEDDWLGKHPATTKQLEALGRARAQSIQDALLGDGQVDAARVFLISADSQVPGARKVRLELSLK